MPLGHAIDTALDRSVVLGYGSLGLALRRHLSGWPADPPRMDGRVVLITGAASGIGLAACRGFAALGARVLPLARTPERAEEAAQRIRQTSPDADLTPLACDVSDLRALRVFAQRLSSEEPRLDVLVNNAGTMPDQRRHTADGHEMMFATHVLAPFALTVWLADLLAGSAPARIINVSSGGMYSQSLPAGDFESEQAGYSPTRLYARTKREEVVITELWARELRDRGIVVHAMHPGWVDTPGVQQALPGFRKLTRPLLRTDAQGADTIVWLGGSPEALTSSGLFWHDRRPRPTHYLLGASEDDPRARQALWELCHNLVAS